MGDDGSQTGLIAGLVVLGVLLLLVIIAFILFAYWVIRKLQEHEKSILRLEEREYGVARHSKKIPRDSAIDLNEVDVGKRPLSDVSAISNERAVQPNMTIMIEKEEASVFGTTPPLGQVMMVAQSYFQVQTNSKTTVPAENIQVLDKHTNRRTVCSQIFTDDWKEGLPTSILFKGSASSLDDVFEINKGLFIHKTIGPKGGKLSISGISLIIPPKALTESILITIGLLWDQRFIPSLTKKQALLSPVVVCQPSGLKFKVPVTLSFPHAADKVTENWIPKIMKREGDLNDNTEWTTLTLVDYDERDVSKYRITLKLFHFTLYTCVGESKPDKVAAKLVHLVAFASKLTKGTFFKPRVYCLNSYKDELDDVKMLENNLDTFSKMAETTQMIIHDNQQDIMVEMAKLSEGWKLAGDQTEILPFEQVWHAFHPHCTFVMKPDKSSAPEVLCEIHGYQAGRENLAAKLKIAERMSAPTSPLTSSEDDPIEDVINELIILLDPENTVGSDAGDWKTLAEKMGCALPRVRWLGTQSHPTQVLINKWIEEKKTFQELSELMEQINRPDAAEEIRKRLPDLDKHSET